MNDANLDATIRRFLKEFGVSGHQAITEALTAAIADGRVIEGQSVAVSATLTIEETGLTHTVDGTLITNLN